MEEQQLNKEQIANRMFRFAAKHWGYSDADLENFDPLVKLLIEACALEVFLIKNEIASSQQRMLERLASLLTPDVYTAVKPAHAVLHAASTEGDIVVNPVAQFYCSKRIPSKTKSGEETNLDVYFSPSGSFKLFSSDVQYLIHQKGIFKMNEDLSKSLVKPLDYTGFGRSVWIGVKPDPAITNYHGLSFYFDFKNLGDIQKYLQLIPYIEISSGQKKIKTYSGLLDTRGSGEGLFFDPMNEFDISLSTEKRVKGIYARNFLTIIGEKETIESGKLEKDFIPASLENQLSSDEAKVIVDKHIWFRLDFPPFMDDLAIEELSILTNCFPVINRRFNSIRYRLQKQFNIVPLQSEEPFLDTYSVKNLEGKNYTANPLNKSDLEKKGTYAVRSSGVERFDVRNAREYLEYLMELLRDESNAFAAYGQDFIASTIKELKESIAVIEQKLNQTNRLLGAKSTFLFVKPYGENESIFVEYWSTNGKLGNQVRSGTALTVYGGAEVNGAGVILRSSTTGGDDTMTGMQLLNAYKYSLLSRGRVVTKQDIVNLCHLTVGKKLSQVEIRNATILSKKPREGLVPCLQIKLSVRSGTANLEEMELIRQEVEYALEQNSMPGQRFEVKIG